MGTIEKRASAGKWATVAVSALCAAWSAPLWAGTFDDAPVLGIDGDGYVFADPAEGILEPGIKAVTSEVNADYPNTFNPSGIENCLMANNPDFACTAEPGSGKRIKTRLTGRSGMDIRLSTQTSGGITEYFLYGKTSNLTGARVTGFEIELGTGSGDNFTPMDSSDPAYAALFDEDYNPRFNLPDGLFGSGGQEDAGTGFFDDARAQMSVAVGEVLLSANDLSNSSYQVLFGDAMLDDRMIPDAYFWDASATTLASDEPVLIAWYNTSSGTWLYGNLGVETPTEEGVVPLSDRLSALADSLGIDAAALGYSGGGDVIPDEVLAAMQANELFEVDVIEDLRNMNLNFIIDLGDVDGSAVTLRLTPVFPDIVAEAQSDYQFDVASNLDMAANVPYLDLGNSTTYQEAISSILALEPADQAEALERVGFSFLSAFKALGFELGRSQILAYGHASFNGDDEEPVLSSQGQPATWTMGDGLSGFVALNGTEASYDTTSDSIGYDIGISSLSAGIEQQLSGDASFGVMLGGVRGTADAYHGRGEIDADGISVSAFGRMGFGEGGLVQAIVGYQDLSFESKRKVMGQTANGETEGSQVFGALQGEWMFSQHGYAFGPTASLEFYDLSVASFKESGAGAWNLDVEDQSGTIHLASIGMRGEYLFAGGPNVTRLSGALTYNSAEGDDELVDSGFIGLPATALSVNGFDEEWTELSVGFATSLGVSGSVIQGGYIGSFGDEYESHALQLAVRMRF
ncbi:choice-of-anchor F family protein [Salipiger sp. CCB-MM3]|uniref:choice-of-anchor F family protein n=1 Tax=Salipiger sp. CCB-MM3 TaxID=1792508 RepID=UPI00187D7C73|nr:choice-of-anchor F family protein [Salipiger sp. CCB-MM3]